MSFVNGAAGVSVPRIWPCCLDGPLPHLALHHGLLQLGSGVAGCRPRLAPGMKSTGTAACRTRINLQALTLCCAHRIQPAWVHSSCETPAHKSGAVLDLIATVSHHGRTPASGHYTADVRQVATPQAQRPRDISAHQPTEEGIAVDSVRQYTWHALGIRKPLSAVQFMDIAATHYCSYRPAVLPQLGPRRRTGAGCASTIQTSRRCR